MISVVVCSASDQKSRAISAHYERVLAGEKFEIILIRNPTSLAGGYNQGISQSRGELLICSHDDIEILTPDFAPRLQAHLQKYDVIGVAGTSRLCSAIWSEAGPPFIFGQVAQPGPPTGGVAVCIFGTPARVVGNIQGMDGLFIAATRKVVETVQFDPVRFPNFHGYDVDFTFAAYLAGFRLAVCNDLAILHASRGKISEAWMNSMRSFAGKYQSKLAPLSGRMFRFTEVVVRTKEEALEVMRATYME